MRELVFRSGIWEEYEDLRRKDKATHDKLCRIIKQLLRNPTEGAGKPERLKYRFTEMWSRRINRKDRVVYDYDDQRVYLFAVKGHYD
ncbi:MAG: Txe/YoeB family addiction module toxin [Gammaproteobacteria bacterium]|nr:Txe/YoeB family addiction module toxin [Gammaproteobacteria bacterium]